MAAGKGNSFAKIALGATLVVAAVTALAGCSVEAPGAAEDHSFDRIERQRAAMGVGPTDTSYDHVERNRMTFGSQPETSYDDVERLRAGLLGN